MVNLVMQYSKSEKLPINAKNKEGEHAILQAYLKDQFEIIPLLINDPNAKFLLAFYKRNFHIMLVLMKILVYFLLKIVFPKKSSSKIWVVCPAALTGFASCTCLAMNLHISICPALAAMWSGVGQQSLQPNYILGFCLRNVS